ncbi:MAG: hypothetical protein RL180_934 [Pseudomonadota bacterium]
MLSTSNAPASTPCAGRCSTVFGDTVCRGCRRFSHEVIDWNRYTVQQRQFIWQRLDQQLAQIIVPIVPVVDPCQMLQFLSDRQIRLPEQASQGRVIYEVLRVVQRAPQRLPESGLGVSAAQIEQTWQQVEQRLYALAVASFEFAWLRAARFGQTTSSVDD